jgi:hypothetical protein
MALRNRSDQKGCPQPALQSLENPSRCSAFWLITKEVAFDRMSGERIVLPTVYPISIASAKFDRSFSAVCYRRSYWMFYALLRVYAVFGVAQTPFEDAVRESYCDPRYSQVVLE